MTHRNEELIKQVTADFKSTWPCKLDEHTRFISNDMSVLNLIQSLSLVTIQCRDMYGSQDDKLEEKIVAAWYMLSDIYCLTEKVVAAPDFSNTFGRFLDGDKPEEALLNLLVQELVLPTITDRVRSGNYGQTTGQTERQA